MATHLSITAEFTDGRIERTERDWSGWDLEAAASIDRAHHCADSGGLSYRAPLTDRQRAAGVIRVTRTWSSAPDRVRDAASSA